MDTGITAHTEIAHAAALESFSEHPLAKAVLSHTEGLGLALPALSDFQALPGRGLEALCKGEKLQGGSMSFISAPETVLASVAKEKAALDAVNVPEKLTDTFVF